MAKGARRERSSFSGGFEPMTRGEVVAILKPTTELALLTEWDLQDIYYHARHRLQPHRAGVYAIDALFHSLTDHDPHPAAFDALATLLSDLADPDRIEAALLRYLWILLLETGYQPRLSAPEEGVEAHKAADGPMAYGFSLDLGGVVADPGPHVGPDGPLRTRAETVEYLRGIAKTLSEEPQGGISGDPETVGRAVRLLGLYHEHCIGRRLQSRADLLD